MRLDQALVQRGLLPTRAKAQAAIAAGAVRCNHQPATKASASVAPTDALDLCPEQLCPYVGRGALKLLHALQTFGLSVAGLRCLDIGASTGGFTQVLLERGATQVVAIDVGHGQLHPLLANDPRVQSHEKTDIRRWSAEPFAFIAIDVSFIAVAPLMPHIARLLQPSASAVVLVKPQFELGAHASKHGVIKNPAQHKAALQRVRTAASACGLAAQQSTPSPILGKDGNAEYLLHLTQHPLSVHF